jgi:hypothetical protein
MRKNEDCRRTNRLYRLKKKIIIFNGYMFVFVAKREEKAHVCYMGTKHTKTKINSAKRC